MSSSTVTPSGPTLGVCETAAQVEKLQADLELGPRIDIYLATTPDAAWELFGRGVPYRKPEDFYDECALCNLSQAVAELQLNWAVWIDDFLRQAIPAFREADFRPAACQMFLLKVLADALFMRAFALKHVLETIQPGKVVCFIEKRPALFGVDLSFREPLYTLILAEMAETWKVSLVRVKSPEQATTAPVRRKETLLRSLARAWLPEPVWDWARTARKQGWQSVLFRPTHRSGGAKIVFRQSYDVALLCTVAEQKGLQWERWSSLMSRVTARARQIRAPEDALRAQWEVLTAEPQFWTPFNHSGLDLRRVMQPHLHHWWHRLIPETWQFFEAARQVLRAERPGALVVPFVYDHQETAVLRAAKALGVPTAIYQHGGFVGYCQDIAYDFQGLPQANYLFTYGEEAARYFQTRVGPPSLPFARPVAVGSARLDAIRRRQDTAVQRQLRERLRRNGKPVILYFSDPYKVNRYLNCGSLPPVSLFELQADLFALFNEFPWLHFIYKMHPGRNSVARELARQKCPACEVIGVERSLTRLIWSVDAIIADFPGTGMLEAMLTQKRIVAYADNRSLRLTRTAAELLRRRVILAETPADFLAHTRSFLASGNFSELSSPDNSFLRAYATHLDDGCSAQRAVEFLQTVISKTAETGRQAIAKGR